MELPRDAACAALFSLSCALCACASAPSDDDVRSALRSQMEAIAGKEATEILKGTFEGIKALSCKSAEAGGQHCDWVGPMGGGGRFVKKDGAWHLVGV